MLADPYNPPPDVTERYEVACSTSSLKVEAEKGGAGDVIIAAGWSESRIGMGLLRLHSEWQGAAKPRRMTDDHVRALAARIKADDETARANRERENIDRRQEGKAPLPVKTPTANPMSRARSESILWYRNELRLLAVSLRSRASVLEQLTQWTILKGLDPVSVGPALHHWLSPSCVVCDGLGKRKVPDAPALSAKQCHACQGTGHTPSPQGASRVLAQIDTCVDKARQSLRNRLRG